MFLIFFKILFFKFCSFFCRFFMSVIFSPKGVPGGFARHLNLSNLLTLLNFLNLLNPVFFFFFLFFVSFIFVSTPTHNFQVRHSR